MKESILYYRQTLLAHFLIGLFLRFTVLIFPLTDKAWLCENVS